MRNLSIPGGLSQVGIVSCRFGSAFVPVGAGVGIIDSNIIEEGHGLASFLRLRPGSWRTLALGVALPLARAQGLWWCWGDPAGIDQRHLHPQARTGPNETHFAPVTSQKRQGGQSALQQ